MLWGEIGAAFVVELRESGTSLQKFLQSFNPAWNLVGRVHFNLAENRRDEQAQFAFLATYTSRLSAHGQSQHLPLGQALREYAGASNRERLLSLLLPVHRAAERRSPFGFGQGRAAGFRRRGDAGRRAISHRRRSRGCSPARAGWR